MPDERSRSSNTSWVDGVNEVDNRPSKRKNKNKQQTMHQHCIKLMECIKLKSAPRRECKEGADKQGEKTEETKQDEANKQRKQSEQRKQRKPKNTKETKETKQRNKQGNKRNKRNKQGNKETDKWHHACSKLYQNCI